MFTVVVATEESASARAFFPNSIVSKGDLQIITAPIGISVTYICSYDINIEAISSAYTVKKPTIVGTATSMSEGTVSKNYQTLIS